MNTTTAASSLIPSSAVMPDDWLRIESMDLEAQGVAHRADGKVVFIEGALPAEEVQVTVGRRKNQWEQGTMTAMRYESYLRVKPQCPHFGLHAGACGGCKMQHLEPSAQVAVKQRTLEDNLWHLGKVRPERMLRPIQGPDWGYRFRARLSVRYVQKKNTVLVGFHERKSRYVADIQSCAVLPPHVSQLLMPLRELIGAMQARDRLPQIELAVAQPSPSQWITALVLRHLEPLTEPDLALLRAFAAEHQAIGLQWWLQPKGPDTVHLLDTPASSDELLAYTLPEFGIHMPFLPTDFTQVNHQINSVLVSRALRLLQAQSTDFVIDWFCGLGNFTLPLATQCQYVTGIEGSEVLVQRAQANAQHNQLSHKTRFAARNLFEMSPEQLMADGYADKWLIDPPREGALALCKALADAIQMTSMNEGQSQTQWRPPHRLVYVSCNPATLARDAGLLVHQAGYRCVAAGVVNMFPHTAHVESMAVFEREGAETKLTD